MVNALSIQMRCERVSVVLDFAGWEGGSDRNAKATAPHAHEFAAVTVHLSLLTLTSTISLTFRFVFNYHPQLPLSKRACSSLFTTGRFTVVPCLPRLVTSVLESVQHLCYPQLSTFIFALAKSAVTLRLSSFPDVPPILSIGFYQLSSH
jgi:hypothetical protein